MRSKAAASPECEALCRRDLFWMCTIAASLGVFMVLGNAWVDWSIQSGYIDRVFTALKMLR